MQKPFALVVFLALTFAAAAIGSQLTAPGLPWLATLKLPPFQPPNWVFGPVWTALYLMIALSGWLSYRAEPGTQRTWSLALWGVQLVLNVAWSGLFFYLRKPEWAVYELLLLNGVIVSYTIHAWKLDWRAGALFIPYLLWTMFAIVLNAMIFVLNGRPA